MSVIVLDRDVIHYEVLGRGRPVIFLHGWVGSWRYWIPVMQAASISYRAYAVDLWGFGDSAKNPMRYSLDEQTRLLDGFLNEMGIGRVVLVGHGLGAFVALLYSVVRPDLVDRVMAVSYPLEDTMLNSRLRSSTPPALADWLLGRSPLTEPARMDAPKTDPSAITSSLNAMAGLDFQTLWGQSRTACLLVHGQNDPAVAAPRDDQFARLPNQTHAVVFDESGHFPMLDESNKFNRLMIDFLALSSGETPRDLQLKDEWKRRVR
jgi:pimeloyl-ACP methyl ester carboxylesterase